MEMKINKNRFLTFLLSLCPGAGHMYLGLIKQGVELMSIFFGSIFVASLLNFGVVLIFLPILVLYSIFDALAKCNMEYDDKNAHADIIKWCINKNFDFKVNNKFLGIILIIVGVVVCFDQLLPTLLQELDIDLWHTMNFLKTGALAIAFIGGGIYLAFRKPKQKSLLTENTENKEN